MILLLPAFAILFASSGGAETMGPPAPAYQLIERIRASARREPPGLEIQSLLATAELLGPTAPSAANSFIRDCLTILKSGKHIDAQITTKVLETGLRIDPAEVLQSAPFVSDRRALDNALIGYYLKQGCPEKAIALVDQSRRQGLTDLSGAILVLRQLIQQQPGNGVTFFNEMLSSFPRIVNPEEALFLLSAVREVVLVNPGLALQAVLRVAVSAQADEFSRGFPGTLTAEYRIAGRDLWTNDVRESVLLPALAYLHLLAPDKCQEFAVTPHQQTGLQTGLQILLSAVTWETILKSTQPLQIVWLKADLKPAPKAELTETAGRDVSSPRAASLLPLRANENVPDPSLDSLFERLKGRETSGRQRKTLERQALQEIRRMPPDRQRVGAAAELLSLAAGQENAANLQSITEFLLSSLLPLARGDLTSPVGEPEDAWCASMYSFVALQIHQHRIATSQDDPSLTTRLALLDLRDRLQEAYDFTLSDANGRKYTLSQFRGRVVLLRFWSPRCGTCVRSLPALEKLYLENSKTNVVVLGISAEPKADTRSFLNGRGYTFPFLSDEDGGVSGYFGIFVIPTTIVIDRTGRIVSSIVDEGQSAQLSSDLQHVAFSGHKRIQNRGQENR